MVERDLRFGLTVVLVETVFARVLALSRGDRRMADTWYLQRGAPSVYLFAERGDYYWRGESSGRGIIV